jgi:hypothetical protein
MSGLAIRALGARAERHAAVPTLLFELEIHAPEPVESISLRCQIRIEPGRRKYSSAEEGPLLELFGEPPRWGETQKPFLWTHASTVVPGFTGSTRVELPVTCTYDFEVAASKYLHALEDGDIPTLLLFNGAMFSHRGGALSVTQIPWDVEAPLRVPVRVWREMMDAYFPNSGWLRLHKDTIDALLRCKAQRALASWDELMLVLLREAGE